MITLTEIKDILRTAGPIFDGGSDCSREEIAEEWVDYLEHPSDVSLWVKAGCWDPATASILERNGFRPNIDTLSYLPGHERNDMDAMYALCNADISLQELVW